MRWPRIAAGFAAGVLLLFWRLTCRYRFVHDPRPTLRDHGRTYIYALLHAHQISAVFANDDRCMTAMVSRSADGDLLVPALRLRRVTPVRGSSRTRGTDKGGREALEMQAEYLRHRVPALLAVDGPQGPRGFVHKGIADLAAQTDTPVVPVVVVPTRRWILSRTWDRLQIPKPLATVTLYFGPVVEPSGFTAPEELANRVSQVLADLEREYDPIEASSAAEHTRQRALRRSRT